MDQISNRCHKGLVNEELYILGEHLAHMLAHEKQMSSIYLKYIMNKAEDIHAVIRREYREVNLPVSDLIHLNNKTKGGIKSFKTSKGVHKKVLAITNALVDRKDLLPKPYVEFLQEREAPKSLRRVDMLFIAGATAEAVSNSTTIASFDRTLSHCRGLFSKDANMEAIEHTYSPDPLFLIVVEKLINERAHFTNHPRGCDSILNYTRDIEDLYRSHGDSWRKLMTNFNYDYMDAVALYRLM